MIIIAIAIHSPTLNSFLVVPHILPMESISRGRMSKRVPIGIDQRQDEETAQFQHLFVFGVILG